MMTILSSTMKKEKKKYRILSSEILTLQTSFQSKMSGYQFVAITFGDMILFGGLFRTNENNLSYRNLTRTTKSKQ